MVYQSSSVANHGIVLVVKHMVQVFPSICCSVAVTMAFANLTEHTLDESLKMLAYYFSRTDSSTFSVKQSCIGAW